MEAQRLADPHSLADRQRAGLLVDADEPAHQIVAATVVGPVLVDHEAGEDAAARRAALLLGSERAEVALQALERRLARELEDDVVLGVGDHRVAPDRLAALRDDRANGHTSDHGADGTFVQHLAVAEQRLRVGLAVAGCEAADERHGVLFLVQLREEPGRRVGEGVDQQRDQVGLVEVRDPGHRDTLVRVESDALERLDHGLRQRCCPDGRGRAVLELAVARDHALGHAAEHVRGPELSLDGLERLLGLAEVVGREEQEGQVDGGAAERRRSFARSLTGSFRRFG